MPTLAAGTKLGAYQIGARIRAGDSASARSIAAELSRGLAVVQNWPRP